MYAFSRFTDALGLWGGGPLVHLCTAFAGKMQVWGLEGLGTQHHHEAPRKSAKYSHSTRGHYARSPFEVTCSVYVLRRSRKNWGGEADEAARNQR